MGRQSSSDSDSEDDTSRPLQMLNDSRYQTFQDVETAPNDASDDDESSPGRPLTIKLTGENIPESDLDFDELLPQWRRKSFLRLVQKVLILFLLFIMLGSTVLSVYPTTNHAEHGIGALQGIDANHPYFFGLSSGARARVEVSVTLQEATEAARWLKFRMEQAPFPCNTPSWQQLGEETTQNFTIEQSSSFTVYNLWDYPILSNSCVRLYMHTNVHDPVAVLFKVHQFGSLTRYEVIFAAIILIGVYILITFDLVHRTVAAAMGAFFTLGVLAVVRKRPSLEEVVRWIDEDTIGLLFGMMVIVDIFSKTGFFEFAAVKAYKLSRGRIRWLVLGLCVITAFLSMVLDNVTTILLIGPVTLQLAQVLNLEPVPMLIAEVLFSNLGGTATMIGDPPNIILGAALELAFADFVINLMPIVILLIPIMAVFVFIYYRKEFNVQCTVDVAELEAKYVIKDVPLLIQASMVLSVVITLFFLEPLFELEQAWIALLGATVLTLVSRPHDIESLLEHIEWATLLFFACLFIMLEGLSELGLVDFIGNSTGSLILMAPPDWQLVVALVLIVWVSAIFSAFIDNIPYTVTMVGVIERLAEQLHPHVPIRPMAWALALGACLGGNGTLIGASANVVAAGILEQMHYKVTFNQFFKVGFPFMLISTFFATIYVIVVYQAMGFSG